MSAHGLSQACLMLQATGLAEHRDSGAPAPSAAAIRMHLPDLSRLSRLTALNLSDNRLTRVPPMIGKLKQLKMLDLSCNQELQVRLLLCKVGGVSSDQVCSGSMKLYVSTVDVCVKCAGLGYSLAVLSLNCCLRGKMIFE